MNKGGGGGKAMRRVKEGEQGTRGGEGWKARWDQRDGGMGCNGKQIGDGGGEISRYGTLGGASEGYGLRRDWHGCYSAGG